MRTYRTIVRNHNESYLQGNYINTANILLAFYLVALLNYTYSDFWPLVRYNSHGIE